MNKKIAFINTLPIPSGQASVNRLLSLSKGLVETGDDVHVLSSNLRPENFESDQIDGIKIYNLGRKRGVSGLFRALISILKKIKLEKYDALISTTNSLLLIYPLAIICKIYNIKFIQEKSEFPFSLMKRDLFHQLYGQLYVNTTYKLMDGMIIMTQALLEYYKGKAKKNCKFIHIPMTVDSSRFNDSKNSPFDFEYIAYCGNMSGNKDGVENLINSFAKVEKKIPELKLLLIGGTNHVSELEKLKNLALSLGTKNIIFYGKANRNEIPDLLNNARILALARPSGLQSQGGFPTKLGEYLITGNPVVVTAVGDIPKYLDNSNSYIVPPDDNEKFTNALIEAYKDREKSYIIGGAGRQTALREFDYKSQAERLHKFLNTL